MRSVPLVRVERSGLEESQHVGDIAVSDADGRLAAWAGDPERPVFARSCMKPLQGAVTLRAVGDLTLRDREVAVMCASHNGEPVHIRVVRSLLERAGLGPDDLLNPPGWPLDPDTMARSRRRSRLLQNCSGKHAGMLLACSRSGWDTTSYVRPSHPLQRRITRAVARLSGVGSPTIGIDGCGLPVHGMPLQAMATLYARLGCPERLGDARPAIGRVTAAMRAEPHLVGGRDRLDTDLMRAVDDVVVKEGAEALVCAALPAAGLGIAVKIADGGGRATAPALIESLVQLDAIPQDLAGIEHHARPVVLGGGRVVGTMAAVFRLRRRR